MSPRTAIQNEKIKRRTEKLIIETSLICFSKRSYSGASMQYIANKAKISKGNLYNYFESKEQLLEKVLRMGLNKIMGSSMFNQMEIITETDFENIIHANFEMIKANRNFWRLYTNLVTQSSAQKVVNRIFAPFIEEFSKIFEPYFIHKGDPNPVESAILFGSTLDGISLGYIMMGDKYPLDQVTKQLIKKFK